ncbi:MAG: VanZ family protein [Deltaproteobacteria bacterium]|nr:VanZ family protein [Deltaproteobacteria bacterium]MBW2419349.1 VanZ family protein [Deltaproteobacteria bacterium]
MDDSATKLRRRTAAASAWVPVALWALLVWGLGGDGFSASETSRFIVPAMRWLFPDMNAREIWQLLYAIRKLAHVVEYAILAILVVRALWLGRRPSLAFSAALALAIVVTFAAADETRQGRSAARTGSHRDVLLDVSGGVVAIGLLVFLQMRREEPLFARGRGRFARGRGRFKRRLKGRLKARRERELAP